MASERTSAPTLFVRSIEQTAAFYGLRLGFAVMFPGDGSLIAICPGGGQLRFRAAGEIVREVRPAGSPRWHALLQIPDADALAADFRAHGLTFATPADHPEGLRGFEIVDPDGHILLFAHIETQQCEESAPMPRPAANSVGWLLHGWIWLEFAGSALPAVV